MKKTTVIFVLALGLITLGASTVSAASFKLTTYELTLKQDISPLCKAVALGDLEGVKTLIKNGADVNEKSNGLLPIHYAAKYNRVEMIKVLVTAGSEIHTPCDLGYTALAHAKRSHADDAAQFLKRFKNKNV